VSFSENDFPALLNRAALVLGEHDSPFIRLMFMEEIYRLMDRLPMYPGIIASCVSRMHRTPEAEDLTPGRKVAFSREGRHYVGEVEALEGDRVRLRKVREVRELPTIEADLSELELVDGDVVFREWPTLACTNRREKGDV